MPPSVRRRNALLEALVRIKNLDPNTSIIQIQAFLYIAENPGINVMDVAQACGIHSSSASRIVKSLAEDNDEDHVGSGLKLIRVLNNPYDAREKFLAVNALGEALCQSLDYVIGQGVQIQSETRPFSNNLNLHSTPNQV